MRTKNIPNVPLAVFDSYCVGRRIHSFSSDEREIKPARKPERRSQCLPLRGALGGPQRET